MRHPVSVPGRQLFVHTRPASTPEHNQLSNCPVPFMLVDSACPLPQYENPRHKGASEACNMLVITAHQMLKNPKAHKTDLIYRANREVLLRNTRRSWERIKITLCPFRNRMRIFAVDGGRRWTGRWEAKRNSKNSSLTCTVYTGGLAQEA